MTPENTDKPNKSERLILSKLYHAVCEKCYKETKHFDTIEKVVKWAKSNRWGCIGAKVFASMSVHIVFVCPDCIHTNKIIPIGESE